MIDVSTGFSATVTLDSRSIKTATRPFEVAWCNVQDPPDRVSSDPEFGNQVFADSLKYLGIKISPATARRHNKIGVVERKEYFIRKTVQELLTDAEYFATQRKSQACQEEVLSRAAFLSNVLLGNKNMSSF